MQLQHQIQTLKIEARQMVAAPIIDARYASRFVGNLLNCAIKAERANLKTDAESLDVAIYRERHNGRASCPTA
ncbi:MAG TPA: hypothetical protein VGI40_27245 [Pirellulaceae bacterium]|jgi:hypothetical protein